MTEIESGASWPYEVRIAVSELVRRLPSGRIELTARWMASEAAYAVTGRVGESSDELVVRLGPRSGNDKGPVVWERKPDGAYTPLEFIPRPVPKIGGATTDRSDGTLLDLNDASISNPHDPNHPAVQAWRTDLNTLQALLEPHGLRIALVPWMSARLGHEHGYPVLSGTDNEIITAALRQPELVLVAASFFRLVGFTRQPKEIDQLVDAGRIVAEGLYGHTPRYLGVRLVGRLDLIGNVNSIKDGVPSIKPTGPHGVAFTRLRTTASFRTSRSADQDFSQASRCRPVDAHVRSWLTADTPNPSTGCVECGRPAESHQGDGGYDCLIRSSHWLIESGIVLASRRVSRPLARAWPTESRGDLTTGVRLSSSRYGKYSRRTTRILRTFITGVPAAAIQRELTRATTDTDPRRLRAIIEARIDKLRRSGIESTDAFEELVTGWVPASASESED